MSWRCAHFLKHQKMKIDDPDFFFPSGIFINSVPFISNNLFFAFFKVQWNKISFCSFIHMRHSKAQPEMSTLQHSCVLDSWVEGKLWDDAN